MKNPKIIKYHFINDKKEFKTLYKLLSNVKLKNLSKKDVVDLDVFLERIAFEL